MGTALSGYQKTLANPVMLSGVGIHNGNPVSATFMPAEENTGIVFHRADNQGNLHEIRALFSEISATDFCTSLGNRGMQVNTVEHLMATLSAMEIDNLIIAIDGAELPILDGTASRFFEAFEQTGLVVQKARRRFIRVLKKIRVDIGGSWAEFRPYDGTRFEVEIDFESSLIGRQCFSGDINSDVFRYELADARTFGFMKDAKKLWASGYARGSSLDNSLIISTDDTIINPGGLRYKDEFVRHKTLDAIGDLSLAGAQFVGCFCSYRAGHRLNVAALQALLSDHSAYEITETSGSHKSRHDTEGVTAVSAPGMF